MGWIKVVILCWLLPLLHGHKECTQRIRWKDLLTEVDSLNRNISPECGHDFDETVLCNPKEMLDQIKYSTVVFMDIMEKAKSVYEKIKNSKNVVEVVDHTRRILKPCVHQPHGAVSEPVAACFAKLEAFLMNQSHCAGEIVNIRVREILQRLQNRLRTERR